MNNNFLKVNDDWTLIGEPSDNNKFMLNICGLPIHVALSNTSIISDDATEFPFTIGGPTSQMHVDKTKYIFAKAIRGESTAEAFIITNTSRISLNDSLNAAAELEKMAVEILHLINRVSTLESKHIDLYYSTVLFIQRYQTDQFKNAIANANLSTSIMQLSSRLYTAERLIGTLRKDFITLSFKVEDLISGGFYEKFTKLEIDITNALAGIERINKRVDDLIKELESGGSATLEFYKLIEPYDEEIKLIHSEFNELNNALVLLTQKHTPTEITDGFDTLIDLVDEDMKGPISAVKQIALELCENEILDREQEEEIETKVDFSDSLLITPPTIEMLMKP